MGAVHKRLVQERANHGGSLLCVKPLSGGAFLALPFPVQVQRSLTLPHKANTSLYARLYHIRTILNFFG